MPKRPCRRVGCSNLIESGAYCPNCAARRKVALPPDHGKRSERGQVAQRLYNNRRWHRSRAIYLSLHPFCADPFSLHYGQDVMANVVDHIIPHRGDPELFWDQGNLQALCKLCHDHKTGRGE